MTRSISAGTSYTDEHYLCSGELPVSYAVPPVADYGDIFPSNEEYAEESASAHEIADSYRQFGVEDTSSFSEYDSQRMAGP